MIILLPAAFIAGVFTIIAPCTLPVIPLVLGSAVGGGRRRPIGVIVGFGLSFVLTAVILAAALATLGLTTDRLRAVAIIGLAGLGVALVLPHLTERLTSRLSPTADRATRLLGPLSRTSGFSGGLVVGAGLGLLWAPCVGPIMAGVIAIAASAGPSLEAAAITLAYVAGVALPMLLIARWGRTAVRTGGGRATRLVGGLMVASALAIATGLDYDIQAAIGRVIPVGYTAALYSVEKEPAVHDEITRLGEPIRSGSSGAAASDPAVGGTTLNLPDPIAENLPTSVPLEDLGPAPELAGISAWINAEPLTLASLRGEVVLVHFWTFGCHNCRNVQPYVKAWYERYKDAGFTVLSVHTPELSFERDIDNVRKAVVDQGVEFPVAFDPDYKTWYGYSNRYWPAFYFVDKAGQIRHEHFGEGDYEGSEQVIRELLAEPGPGT